MRYFIYLVDLCSEVVINDIFDSRKRCKILYIFGIESRICADFFLILSVQVSSERISSFISEILSVFLA